MNEDKIIVKDSSIINKDNKISNEENNLLNILTNQNIFNDKDKKIILINNYAFLIRTFKNLENKEFINFFTYLSQNIPVSQLLIFGYIEANIEKEIDDNALLKIISKGINLDFNKSLFYFIYEKLSKKFRKHLLLKDFQSIQKFEKLFNVWKLLYNNINPKTDQDINQLTDFIFIPNLNDEKNFIEIDVNDENGTKNLKVSIYLKNSPILNLNKIGNYFSFVKLYDDKDEIFELKYNELNLEENESFSDISKIKFDFSEKGYDIYINKKLNVSKTVDMKINFNSIKKIEILNNFLGEVSSVVFKKNYGLIANYEESCPMVTPLKMKIYKNNLENKIQIKTNAFRINTNEKEISDSEKQINSYIYQYCGAYFNIKINYKQIENKNKDILKKGKINLCEIEYLGGLNCFIPLFKIIKYIIDNLKLIYLNKNPENEEGKKEFYSEINKYIDKSFDWLKDILKTIIKMICISESNYKKLRKIIIPLIGALGEIYHSLNELSSSKIISEEKILNLFNDEVFSSLYIILLISSFPYNIKEMYRKIVGINKNLDNLKISLNSIIDIDIEQIKNSNWYFTLLVICLEFIFIYFDTSKKVPYTLINTITFFLSMNKKKNNKDIVKKEEAIMILTNIMNKFYNEEDKNNDENLIEDKNFLNDNNYYLQLIIYMITTFVNIKQILKKNGVSYEKNSFYDKFLKFFEDYFRKKDKINITDDYAQMIINFKYHPEEIEFLQKLFPFLGDSNFNAENELIMDELIDYHGKYHRLMKELFIFNKLWSNQKLFFNTSLDKIKSSKLKYKNINYYTRNYQRPIIYPILDYKYRYPDFSNFSIDQDFYNTEEDTDDYNFDLDCPELDKYIEEYNKEIFQKIEKNGKINTCEACLVKQTYHVKGNLFIFYDNNKIIIYFYSYSSKLQNNEEEILCCNIGTDEETSQNKNIANEKQKTKLCYGSIFKCPKKDQNRKIKISLDNIRLILSRIYFYHNSALEIFTETKSYYFNFVSEDKRNSLLISTFMFPCQESFFPINFEGNIIGYMKINEKIIEKNKFSDLISQNNSFIDFISDQTSKGGLCEMCIFDIIMLINLISNRSFNDLYQYPIFPILYFYDRQTKDYPIRDFKEHIGFQEFSEKSKLRKNMFINAYQETINELNENGEYENENNENPSLCYFNTHYSNCIYVSNYLIRLFPYTFSAIENQGKGFDSPNRLFSSIEDTLFNISSQKSDLRELIPEFFYLPEIFMNINSIKFGIKSNNEKVDDVSMPKFLKNKRNNSKKADNFEYDEKLVDDFNVVAFSDNYHKKENFKKFFIFVEDMKNRLENLTKDLSLWINIIFGLNQRFTQKNEQYFRSESYIDYKNIYKNYLKDSIILASAEFGVIPIQTIFDNKILMNLQKRKSNEYQNHVNKGINIINSKIKKMKNNTMKISGLFNIYKGCLCDTNDENHENDKKSNEKKLDNYFNNEYNDYWDEQFNIDFRINNIDNFGKLEVYINNNLISEIIDHNDIIIDLFYNRRLNMFATTSYDGFICVYILPNKLFCMIKHPNNLFYDKVYLSANPFPSIIGYEKDNNILTSYSLSGMKIKKYQIEKQIDEKISELTIEPVFNTYGGAFKDKLKIIIKDDKRILNKFYNLPFFEKEYKEIIYL